MSFHFLHTASILNCTNALSEVYLVFDRLPPLGGIGRPKKKIKEWERLHYKPRKGN